MQVRFSPATLALIDAAFAEDLGPTGDVTAQVVEWRPRPPRVTARVAARTPGILAGNALLPALTARFARRGGRVKAVARLADGATLARSTVVAELSGRVTDVLAIERTLLNFLGRLSGVATRTHEFVQAAQAVNPAVQVLDTRKTLPGWRELDKYAVRCGGGANHRHGLFDAVLVKDNHLAALAQALPKTGLAVWLAEIVRRARRAKPRPGFIEVEVDSIEHLEIALTVDGLDVILLDNFDVPDLRRAVRLRNRAARRVLLEASGGVSLKTIAAIARTGVDRISVGALTHSAPALDLGLDF